MFQPAEHAVKAVKEWLASSGIDDSRIVHYENKGWLAFQATAEEAESMLHAEFHEHEHMHSDKVRIGCDSYHIPESVAEHVDFVTPGIKLTPVVKRSVEINSNRPHHNRPRPYLPHPWTGNPSYQPPAAAQLPPDLRSCGVNITPPCYTALYQLPNPKKTFAPGNSLGLYEQGDFFSTADLDLFFKAHAPWVPQGTYPKPGLIDGAMYGAPQDNTTLVGGESNIDIDIATSIIYPQTVTVYQVDDLPYSLEDLATTNLFNTFLDALDGSYCNYTAFGETGDDPAIDPIYPDPQAGGYKGHRQCGVFKPTKVISASYGQAEADLPINYSKRQCNEFMKLGLQGHSILVASGDYGVGSFPAEDTLRGGTGCLGPQGKILNPQ